MIEGYETITARFRAYFDDYEAKAAVRRDRTARWYTFRPQDYVMLERPPRAGDQSKGRIAAMEGPYRVVRMIGEHRAVLEDPETQELVPRAPAGE